MSDQALSKPPTDFEELSKQREKVFGALAEKIKPWLLEFGNWIFGGLLAFNLVIVGAVLTVGPVEPAIMISIAAFACALPLNVTGLFMLKLIKDLRDLAAGDVMKQAFEDANVPHFQPSEQQEAESKRGTNVGLRYVFILAGVSAILTLFGMIAALWYMAWWVAALFCLMVVASILIAVAVFARMRPQGRSNSESDKELRRQLQEQHDRKQGTD